MDNNVAFHSNSATSNFNEQSELIHHTNHNDNNNKIGPMEVDDDDDDRLFLAASEERPVADGAAVLNGGAGSSSSRRSIGLGMLPFAVLVFYNVSGGPFGIEPAVRAGGPGWSVLGFLLGPLIWSVPEALVTAELGSAYPDASAGVAWVEEAFGRQAGSLLGWLSWISGATDNAIYPVLFLDYLLQAVEYEPTETERASFLILTATVLASVNLTGLKIVGNTSLVIAVLSMSPFVVLCILGAPTINTARWYRTTSNNNNDDFVVRWTPLLNNLFWNLNSFDSGAAFTQEVTSVQPAYVRGMHLSVVLVTLGYLLPLLAALGAADSTPSDWTDGHLAVVGGAIGGDWLGRWIVVAAGVSNVALFLAELSTDSYQLLGMAERGLIPPCFAVRNGCGTPTVGILACWAVIVSMSLADFSTLVERLNFCYALSLLLEYAAFIALRIKKGDVPRPYRIPLGTCGCIMMLIPAVAGIVTILFLASWQTYLFSAAFILLGVALHLLQQCLEKTEWCSSNSNGNNNNDDFDAIRRHDDGSVDDENEDINVVT